MEIYIYICSCFKNKVKFLFTLMLPYLLRKDYTVELFMKHYLVFSEKFQGNIAFLKSLKKHVMYRYIASYSYKVHFIQICSIVQL